jgi:hypothetical protein
MAVWPLAPGVHHVHFSAVSCLPIRLGRQAMADLGEKTFGELLVEAAEEMLAVHRGEKQPARVDYLPIINRQHDVEAASALRRGTDREGAHVDGSLPADLCQAAERQPEHC